MGVGQGIYRTRDTHKLLSMTAPILQHHGVIINITRL